MVDPLDKAAANIGTKSSADIGNAIDDTFKKAEHNGMSDEGLARLKCILESHMNELRIKIGFDLSAKGIAYEVQLKMSQLRTEVLSSITHHR